MEEKVKNTALARIPVWTLLTIVFVASIASAIIFEHITILSYSTLGIMSSIFYLIIIPLACYLICRKHPKSLWHTPFVCNPVAVLGTIFHPLAWTTLSEYLFWVGSLVLSVIAAVLGARIGRLKTNQAK